MAETPTLLQKLRAAGDDMPAFDPLLSLLKYLRRSRARRVWASATCAGVWLFLAGGNAGSLHGLRVVVL